MSFHFTTDTECFSSINFPPHQYWMIFLSKRIDCCFWSFVCNGSSWVIFFFFRELKRQFNSGLEYLQCLGWMVMGAVFFKHTINSQAGFIKGKGRIHEMLTLWLLNFDWGTPKDLLRPGKSHKNTNKMFHFPLSQCFFKSGNSVGVGGPKICHK